MSKHNSRYAIKRYDDLSFDQLRCTLRENLTNSGTFNDLRWSQPKGVGGVRSSRRKENDRVSWKGNAQRSETAGPRNCRWGGFLFLRNILLDIRISHCVNHHPSALSVRIQIELRLSLWSAGVRNAQAERSTGALPSVRGYPPNLHRRNSSEGNDRLHPQPPWTYVNMCFGLQHYLRENWPPLNGLRKHYT